MNEYFYGGEVVELDATIAKKIIEEYQATVWEAISSRTPTTISVEILSKTIKEYHITELEDDATGVGTKEEHDLEMLHIKLEELEEAIERATKTAYVNKLKREIRNLCKITGDNPDIESDFSDPA